MTPNLFPDPTSPPLSRHKLQHVRLAQVELNRAYEQARGGGYRPDSPEMEALARAEDRYQQAMRD